MFVAQNVHSYYLLQVSSLLHFILVTLATVSYFTGTFLLLLLPRLLTIYKHHQRVWLSSLHR